MVHGDVALRAAHPPPPPVPPTTNNHDDDLNMDMDMDNLQVAASSLVGNSAGPTFTLVYGSPGGLFHANVTAKSPKSVASARPVVLIK
jgi:hypothetical protein